MRAVTDVEIRALFVNASKKAKRAAWMAMRVTALRMCARRVLVLEAA